MNFSAGLQIASLHLPLHFLAEFAISLVQFTKLPNEVMIVIIFNYAILF